MFRKYIPAMIMVSIFIALMAIAPGAVATSSRLGTQFFEEDNNHLLQYTLASIDPLKARVTLNELIYVDKNTRLTVAAESVQIGLAAQDIPNWIKGKYENIRYADVQFKAFSIYNPSDSLIAEKLQITFKGYVKDLQDAINQQIPPKEAQSFHLVLSTGKMTVPEAYRRWYFEPAAVSYSEMTLDGLYQGPNLTVNANVLSPVANCMLNLALMPNLKDYQQSIIKKGNLTLTNMGTDADNLISNLEVMVGKIIQRDNNSINLECIGTIADPIITGLSE